MKWRLFLSTLVATGGLAGCVTMNTETARGMSSDYICELMGPAYLSTASEQRAAYDELARRGERCRGNVAEPIDRSSTPSLAAAPPGVESRASETRAPNRPSVATGTAFKVGPKNYVTAAHVVDGATKIELNCPLVTTNASVQMASASADIAILLSDSSVGSWIPVAGTQGAELGDPIFVVSYPVSDLLGNSPRYTDGTVSALSGLGDDGAFLQFSAPVQPGSSGGPVISPKRGVVGIVASSANVPAFAMLTGAMPQGLNFAAKADMLRTLSAAFEFHPGPVTVRDALAATCRLVVFK